MTVQLSIFDNLFNLVEDEKSQTSLVCSPEKKEEDLFNSLPVAEEHHLEHVQDVRTEKQRGRKISYDVGEKIWGARKDLESFKKSFLDKPDHKLLEEIAALDAVEADKLATKKNVFSWFSMEDCHDRGVDINAAYGMYLMIRRIPENSKGLERSKYMKALVFISDCFKTIRTLDEFIVTFKRFSMMVADERELRYREKQLMRINEEVHSNTADNPKPAEYYLSLLDRTYEAGGIIHVIENIKDEYGLDKLGDFSELLSSSKKQKTFKNSLYKYSSWDEYFKAKNEKKKPTGQGGGSKKPVWERKLPVEPKRIGGREVEEIKTPEYFREFFGFKGVQFGHYVDDLSGRAHLVNSSRALVDLADILGIEVRQVSLGNELSIAFGARGKGRALGHYERGYKIINLTKEKGSLGVLSHEWFHAYDHFLSRVITGVEENLLTEGKNVVHAPLEVFEAWQQLIEAMKEGKSTAYIDVANAKHSYRIRVEFIERYNRFNGNLQGFMDECLKKFDERMERFLSGIISPAYYEKKKKEYERKRKKALREYAEALAQHHKEQTGEELSKIPYTVNQSQFYRNALVLDREKEGGYWSSNHELAARAFEAYVYHKLKERGWRSDYLVCGLDAVAYPIGEELERIINAFEKFLKVTLPYLKNSI